MDYFELGMGSRATETTGLETLTVPRAGLSELFRVWTGDGPLVDAVAACSGDDGVEWTPASVRRRSRRVLLGMLEDDLLALPSTLREWTAYLPLESVSRRQVHCSPRSGTRWAETVRRFGWPPSAYETRARSRQINAEPLATLAWLARRLTACVADVRDISPDLCRRLEEHVGGLSGAIAQTPGHGRECPPDRSELLALAHGGFPWRVISRIAALVARAERDLEFLAYSLLEPDPDMESRLFQISTFGSLVSAIRTHGCRITWKSPLGSSTSGPHVEVKTREDATWDLWFDSGSARTYYSAPQSAYWSAVESIAGVGSSIRPDMLFIRHPYRALVLECKWSAEPSYVGRDGYHQASSYALDTLNGLASEVWSFVVGPQEIVPIPNYALAQRDSMNVVLGSTSTEKLKAVVGRFLGENP